MAQSCTAGFAFQSPSPTPSNILSNVEQHGRIIAYADGRGPIPNGGHRSLRLVSVVQPDRFRTTDVRASALNA
jgi:hypothetical protein